MRRGAARRFDASRGHLLTALDRSLARLGFDHVDVWQLHAWDPDTPLEETLAAADDAVRSGRARYVGVSNYAGWQLARAATWQDAGFGACPRGERADGVLADGARYRARGASRPRSTSASGCCPGRRWGAGC